MMRKKLQGMAVIAALLALAFAMVTVSCPDPADGGGVGGGGGGGEGGATGLSGKWINQSGTSSPYTIVILEFTANQLKITSGTDVATYSYTDTEGEIKTGTSASSITEVFCESYDITADVLTFTGGKSDDDFPSTNFYRVNTLNANQWKDGVITSDSKGQVWYSFNVTASTTYRMWWNDGYEGSFSTGGNGLKTLDIYVSGYYNSGTSIFTNVDTAWSTAQYITPTTSQAGTVYVKVTPYSTGGTGTFGITYTTGGTGAVTERPNAPFNPPSATPLTLNEWKDGEITADSNGAVWYSFNVTAGTVTNPAVYNVWWNESGSNGNNTKTLNVSVRGLYSDGTSAFSTASTAWTTSQVFTATKSGTVYLKVTPGTSGQTGTFGIVYNTGIGAARPGVIFNPPNPVALTADTWADGEITGTGSAGEAWYSLTVTANTPYYFWWNESGTYSNRTKTLDIQVSAINSEGTSISSFTNVDSAWTTVKSYTPTADGTLYLKVTPYYTTSNNTGTFGIVYSETNARPPVPVPAVNPIALTSGEWKKGEITGNSDGAVWYSFTVTASTAYRLWWNDSYNGNGFFRTLDVRASAWYGSTGDNVFYDLDNGWNPSTVPSYTPAANDTVYVKVYPKTEGDTGTFDIVYSDTATARPKLPFAPGDPPNPVALTEGEWQEGEIASAGGDAWYSIEVTSGTTYRVWFDEAGRYGNGFKTLNVTVNGWYSDDTTTSVFFGSNGLTDSWGASSNSTNNFTPTANTTTTVYIRVRADSSGNTGTFAIVYGTGSSATMPDPLFTAPSDTIPLTENQWADGEITSSTREVWYSFTAASGTNYRLWMNDNSSQASSTGDGTKTLDANMTIWYGNTETIAIIGLDYAWTYASDQQFTPNATQAGTIYLRVSPRIAGNTGTFGIAYNSGTNPSRPPVPLTVPANAIALTAGQWADDEITDSTSEFWYSFTVASGTTYNLWWNDSGTYNGDGSKTLDVRVSAWYENGDNISDGEDSAWDTAKSFTPNATQAGTVYVRVYPSRWSNSAYNKGTFGIVYNTGVSATRPLIPIAPVNPTELTADTWADGAITSSIREVWYSFTVTSGTAYRLWWNEDGGSSIGNGTKTLNVKVSGYYTDGAVIFNDVDTAWTTAQSFTPNATQAGTVYLKVTPSTSSSTSSGTFGIVYSATATRPTLPAPPNAIALTAGQWEDGAITAAGGEVWYSFTVTSGTQYRVWWNDSWQGNSMKTLNVEVGGWYGGTGNFIFSETDSGYTYEQSFTPNATQAGTVYLKVTPYMSSTNTGTFGIVYTANNATRPVIPFDPPDATALTEGVWMAGNIATGEQEWFSFTATATTQYIHVTFGTLSDLYVQVYGSDGSTVGAETNLWSGTRNINRSLMLGQEYYIRVRPYGSGSGAINGNYQIAFNTSSTAPAPAPASP